MASTQILSWCSDWNQTSTQEWGIWVKSYLSYGVEKTIAGSKYTDWCQEPCEFIIFFIIQNFWFSDSCYVMQIQKDSVDVISEESLLDADFKYSCGLTT